MCIWRFMAGGQANAHRPSFILSLVLSDGISVALDSESQRSLVIHAK